MRESRNKKNYYFLIFIIVLFLLFVKNTYAKVLERNRPFAVMIGNSPKEIKVQKGIEEADIIYEIDVEYPFTRLMALYFGDDNITIGPVRSSRYYFSRISIEWSAFFAHCGGQNLKNENVLDLDELLYHNLFWRDVNIGGWINLFTDINILERGIKTKYFTDKSNIINHSLLNFNSSSPHHKNEITKITIKHSTDYIVSYHYDPYEKVYHRHINGMPQLALESQKPVAASNIIIQYVPIEKIEGDESGRVQVNLIGEGIGKFFQSGDYEPIKWVKGNKEDQTIFYDSNCLPIVLEKGLVWVHILSVDNEVWFK